MDLVARAYSRAFEGYKSQLPADVQGVEDLREKNNRHSDISYMFWKTENMASFRLLLKKNGHTCTASEAFSTM